MKIHAAILGGSGYGAGELLSWMVGHPHFADVQVISRSEDAPLVTDVHPHLRGFYDGKTMETGVDWERLGGGDVAVVFAAMPHGEFQKRLPALLAEAPAQTIWVDLSADYRLADLARFEKFYGPHASADLIPSFTYALPELDREAIRGASRLACPGCFATGLQLGASVFGDFDFLAVTGITGSTGSGTSPSATTHHPTRASDLRPYKVLNHQHMGEVEQRFGAGKLHFTPLSGPFARGIFLTLTGQGNLAEVQAAIARLDAENPFIRSVPVPRLATVVGSNFVEIACAGDGGAVSVTLALDNLVKGMAGQALQALNIALGLDETVGLWRPARFPG